MELLFNDHGFIYSQRKSYMRSNGTIIVGGMIVISMIILVSFREVKQHPSKTAKEVTSGFALVELFTSQGCSSCPPADTYLSKLIKNGESDGKKIIALSFHVSYWNRLGWVDPFSDENFTHRQQRYSQAFGSSTIYTPQMIVNGSQSYASSRPGIIDQGVNKMLSREPVIKLNASVTSLDHNAIEFKVKAAGEMSDKSLYLHAAIVEKGLTTAIKRGENIGRTLHHDNVVRIFNTWDLSKSIDGKLSLEFPNDVKIENASLVVYAQKPSTMEVLGADQLGLNNIK